LLAKPPPLSIELGNDRLAIFDKNRDIFPDARSKGDQAMALLSSFWSANQRLQRAVKNSPGMHAFEPDHAAVKLLQQALADTGILPSIKVDGIYGQQTAGAVSAVEARFNLGRDGGVAGQQVLGVLDILLQGGRLAAELALLDLPLARRKVRAAITALTSFAKSRANGTAPSSVTVEALRVHFRLSIALPTIGITRQLTDADVTLILGTFNQVNGLLLVPGGRMRSGVPVNGLATPAESPLNGPITFGPGYSDRDSHFTTRTGDNSRAAMVMHESVHVFDPQSGAANIHIAESSPAYALQSADLSLHNPSSYAAFAAHIDLGSDPNPRFGGAPPGDAL
jgi:peptidoglycan hydrolase-like protein with peptidoglycan-binding domain